MLEYRNARMHPRIYLFIYMPGWPKDGIDLYCQGKTEAWVDSGTIIDTDLRLGRVGLRNCII